MKIKELPFSIYHSIRLRYFTEPSDEESLPVIVSLTSIPSRLATLDIVISSILDQNQPPQKIILWLNNALKNSVPKRLIALQSPSFEIHYNDDTTSYRKLLPTLKLFQKSTIVTCDDDMIYPSNWLEHLYSAHLNNENSVISQVGRMIKRDDNNKLKCYKEWPFIRTDYTSKELMPIGYGGVLYPPDTFNDQIFDELLYLKLSPKADDLWFKAMAYLNGKTTVCASEKARPIPIIRSQKEALNNHNIDEDRNRNQWQALCENFPELEKLS